MKRMIYKTGRAVEVYSFPVFFALDVSHSKPIRLWATMVYGLNARKFYLLKAVVYGLFAVACQPLAVVYMLRITEV